MNPFEGVPGREEEAALWAEMKESEPAAGSTDSTSVAGSEGLPVPEPESGCDLLDDVRAWLTRFITVRDESDLDVLTLWAAHTYAGVRLRTSPRLQIDSPVPESGKTTVLEHLQRLSYRPLLASAISSAALLARLVAEEPRTLLLDEVDRTLDEKSNPSSKDFIAILNSGYKVGATRPVLVPEKDAGWVVDEMSTFAYVAMAGNQPNLPDDTMSRTIRILLLPDWRGRAEESDWELLDEPAESLGDRLGRWVGLADLSHRPELPDGVKARFREKWLPLARIAHAAGGRWPGAVWDLAKQDVADYQQDRDEGLAAENPAALLLRHIYELWPADRDFWPTREMLAELVNSRPDSWSKESAYGKALTAQRMGRMLSRSYKIRSTREDPSGPRGYRRRQFGDALTAIGRIDDMAATQPAEPATPVESAEPADDPGYCSICGMNSDVGNGHTRSCPAAKTTPGGDAAGGK